MLIVGIAWIYVVLMMAVVEKSFIAGLMTFIFYGVGARCGRGIGNVCLLRPKRLSKRIKPHRRHLPARDAISAVAKKPLGLTHGAKLFAVNV
jgi:hypothetical protein